MNARWEISCERQTVIIRASTVNGVHEQTCEWRRGCVSSPLGFVGFLTELSCPLTSCSLLSSSLLFSRVSSSLDLPILPFFPAVHEKMTKGCSDLCFSVNELIFRRGVVVEHPSNEMYSCDTPMTNYSLCTSVLITREQKSYVFSLQFGLLSGRRSSCFRSVVAHQIYHWFSLSVASQVINVGNLLQPHGMTQHYNNCHDMSINTSCIKNYVAILVYSNFTHHQPSTPLHRPVVVFPAAFTQEENYPFSH